MAGPQSAYTQYLDLSTEARATRIEAKPVLDELVATLQSGASPTPDTRRALLEALLSSVPQLVGGRDGDDKSVLCSLAAALKLLGRSPEGSEPLASAEGLRALLQLAQLDRLERSFGTANDEDGGMDSLPNRELPFHTAESLRCFANVLTLQPSARDVAPGVLLEGSQLDGIVSLLPHVGWAAFLSARILFLATAGSSNAEIVKALSEKGAVAGLRRFVLAYLTTLEDKPQILEGSMPSATDALKEHLKFAYNFMLQYGRQSAPATGFPVGVPDKSASDASSSLSVTTVRPFLPLFQPYYRLSCLVPLYPPGATGRTPNPLALSALNTLLNYPVELEELDEGWQYSWCQPLSQKVDVEEDTTHGALPLVERLLELVEGTCEAWFPYTAPPASDTQKALPNVDGLLPAGDPTIVSSKIEEVLGPALLLLRKVTLLSTPCERVKQKILPDALDRSVPLSYHSSLTGHLIRLSSSILLPNASYGAIELIYNLCNREPEELSRAVGYGLASGWLQSRGELIPPPASTDSNNDAASSSSPKPIDPITGAAPRVPTTDKGRQLEDMTDEEKEREAEKLFVLFERMQRTGVISAENPVGKAQREGRFEELDSGAKDADEEDEKLEREVEKDMEGYKARKKAAESGGAGES